MTLLRPTQAALLNWAVELMSDVVEEEELNKMNARNVAMVFAPNMTQVVYYYCRHRTIGGVPYAHVLLIQQNCEKSVDHPASTAKFTFFCSMLDVRSTDSTHACRPSHELSQDTDLEDASGAR